MAPRSSIKTLPSAIRSAADQALKDGATIDQVVDVLRQLGADVSRSAVGRYKREVDRVGERIKRAREISAVFVEKLGAAPDGRQGRLITELMQTVVFDFLVPVGEGEAPKVDPEEIMFLARAIKDLSSAEKITADRILMIRKSMAAEATKAMEEAAKATGGEVSEATMAEFKARFLGVIK